MRLNPRLIKTANHLKFLRSVQKRVGEYGGCRLILSSGEKYVTVKDIAKQIKDAKNRLRKGIEKSRM